MAAIVKIIPQKDWEVVKKYLGEDEGCVLIPESVLRELPEESRKELMDLSDSMVEYDYGGDADVWVDIVRSPDAYFLRKLLQEQDPRLSGMDAMG